jgi:hypothetical protein
VIAGVQSEVGHVKGDVERSVRALTTDAAVRILRHAFEEAGVLPSGAAATASAPGAKSLADALAAEPAESFESLRFRGAYELAIEMIEQEHGRRRRHASILLRLCYLGAAIAFALVAAGVFWRGGALRLAVLFALFYGPIGFLFAHASRLAERVREDLRTLAKVELR